MENIKHELNLLNKRIEHMINNYEYFEDGTPKTLVNWCAVDDLEEIQNRISVLVLKIKQ